MSELETLRLMISCTHHQPPRLLHADRRPLLRFNSKRRALDQPLPSPYYRCPGAMEAVSGQRRGGSAGPPATAKKVKSGVASAVTDRDMDELVTMMAKLSIADDDEMPLYVEKADGEQVEWLWIRHGDGWAWWWNPVHGWWQP